MVHSGEPDGSGDWSLTFCKCLNANWPTHDLCLVLLQIHKTIRSNNISKIVFVYIIFQRVKLYAISKMFIAGDESRMNGFAYQLQECQGSLIEHRQHTYSSCNTLRDGAVYFNQSSLELQKKKAVMGDGRTSSRKRTKNRRMQWGNASRMAPGLIFCGFGISLPCLPESRWCVGGSCCGFFYSSFTNSLPLASVGLMCCTSHEVIAESPKRHHNLFSGKRWKKIIRRPDCTTRPWHVVSLWNL